MSELRLQKKFLKPDSVDESKIKLSNDGALRARNAADSADIDLLKLDAANKLQLLVMPEVSADAASPNQLVRKSQLDAEIAAAGGDISALETRVQAIEDDYGVAGGLATLDGSGKIPSSQVPAIAITDVYVVADIAARDALTVEEGDVAKVTDAGAGLPRTYIYDGSSWIEIESGSDVDSVNGQVGAVVLDAGDIGSDGASTVQADIDALEAEDLTFLKLDGTRPMSGNLDLNSNDLINVSAIESVAVSSMTITAGLQLDIMSNGVMNLQPGSDFAVNAAGDATLTGESVTLTSTVGPVTLSPFAGQSVVVNSDLDMSTHKIVGLVDGVAATDAATKGQVDAEETRALAAEAALDSRATALEVASLQFMAPELFVLTATDITNGYIDLTSLAVQYSINAFVDRLAIHEGNDYTVSVVGGITRMTFAGPLITPGQEKLSAGDEIRVKYAKRAI